MNPYRCGYKKHSSQQNSGTCAPSWRISRGHANAAGCAKLLLRGALGERGSITGDRCVFCTIQRAGCIATHGPAGERGITLTDAPPEVSVGG